MASEQILQTIMGLATVFGSSIGLVLAGILLIALLLRVLDRTQRIMHRAKTVG